MIENPIAEAWKTATSEDQMGLAFASPFRFIDNRGQERQCTGLLPHVGAPMGTLIGTRFDPDHETFIASVRGLGYYAVILNSAAYEKYDATRFVNAVKDWGWYGPASLLPSFFEEGNQEGQP